MTLTFTDFKIQSDFFELTNNEYAEDKNESVNFMGFRVYGKENFFLRVQRGYFGYRDNVIFTEASFKELFSQNIDFTKLKEEYSSMKSFLEDIKKLKASKRGKK